MLPACHSGSDMNWRCVHRSIDGAGCRCRIEILRMRWKKQKRFFVCSDFFLCSFSIFIFTISQFVCGGAIMDSLLLSSSSSFIVWLRNESVIARYGEYLIPLLIFLIVQFIWTKTFSKTSAPNQTKHHIQGEFHFSCHKSVAVHV